MASLVRNLYPTPFTAVEIRHYWPLQAFPEGPTVSHRYEHQPSFNGDHILEEIQHYLPLVILLEEIRRYS